MLQNYPYTQRLIREHKLETYLETMDWHYFSNTEELNNKLQDVLQTFEDLTSANIPLIHAARQRVDQEYLEIGSKLQVFAREQARHELGLSNEDVTRIFANVELGGRKYLNKN